MGCVRVTSPPIFQSKLFCISLFYLLTAISLSLCISFSHQKCLFPSPHLLPLPLFRYPASYGEHKHSLPASHASCNSPVFFSDYHAAFEEIFNLCRNKSSSLLDFKYLQGKRETFAGNFSTKERRSFFDHRDDRVLIPCGFLRDFYVKESDRVAMEQCAGVVVVSVIFGDHDKIRQPKDLGFKTLEVVSFFMFIDDSTLKGLSFYNIHAGEENSMIGAWRIVRLFSGDLPYTNLAMNGVIPKHLIHRLFPNAKFSLWIDAKLQLTVDPLLLLHSLIVSKNADMAVAKHPFSIHTAEEAMATSRWRKWGDIQSLRVQMETYCENGLKPWSPEKLPYTTDVPDTAMIARRHGAASDLFSCLLFNELEAFNPRDQLAFAYVRDMMNPPIKINMFEVEVFEQVVMEFRHNLKAEGGFPAVEGTGTVSQWTIKGSKCEKYLHKMWGEDTY